jgi:hypothetical protein
VPRRPARRLAVLWLCYVLLSSPLARRLAACRGCSARAAGGVRGGGACGVNLGPGRVRVWGSAAMTGTEEEAARGAGKGETMEAEASEAAAAWVAALTAACRGDGGEEYAVVASRQLVGVLACVLVRRRLQVLCTRVPLTTYRLGWPARAGMGGGRGGE